MQRPCIRHDSDIRPCPGFWPAAKWEEIFQSSRRYPASGGRPSRGTGATCLPEVKAHAYDEVKINFPLSTAMYCDHVLLYGVRLCGGRVLVFRRMSTVSIEKRFCRASQASDFPHRSAFISRSCGQHASLDRPRMWLADVEIHVPAQRMGAALSSSCPGGLKPSPSLSSSRASSPWQSSP